MIAAVALAALALTGAAPLPDHPTTGEPVTLRMDGDAKARHFNWAATASARVPLPTAQFEIMSGNYDPEYLPAYKLMFLPSVGSRPWQETYRQERYLFLHELGHVYDYSNLTPAKRAAFKQLVGTTCKWQAAHCRSWNWNNESVADVAPVEMYAEAYVGCALGLTRVQVDAG